MSNELTKLPVESEASYRVRLQGMIKDLKERLAWQEQEYAKLQQLYTELADTWNAFQALHKPTQRNVHRAEATGYLARKLIQLLYKGDAPMDVEQLQKLLGE